MLHPHPQPPSEPNDGLPLVSRYADDPEMADLVATFVAGLPPRLAAIELAAEAGDTERLHVLAHQLKGAAGGFGFEPVTQMARCLDRAVVDGRPREEVRALVAELAALCGRARVARSRAS